MKTKIPETVALVAMGQSRIDYEADVMKAGSKDGVADETWVINKLGAILQHDIVFRMDDLKEEHSCNLKNGTNRDKTKTIHDTFDEWLRNHDKPIITSTAYEESIHNDLQVGDRVVCPSPRSAKVHRRQVIKSK